MSKFKIVNLIDKLFITIVVFLLVFAWINFYIRNLWTTFCLSLILTFAIIFLLNFFISKRNTKKELAKATVEEINKYFTSFILSPAEKKLSLIKSALEKNYPCELKSKMLTYTKDNKKHLIILATKEEKLTQYQLLSIVGELSNVKTDVIDIVCNTTDTLNTKIFKDKEIEILDKTSLYNLLKQANVIPQNDNIRNDINKLKFNDIITRLFMPKKAKSYFLCGLILIFSSIILPYNAYYIVFGSILLMFSLICKLLPLINKNR